MKNPTILFLHKFRFVIVTILVVGFVLFMKTLQNEPSNFDPDKEFKHLLVK
jgi:hypothetical protein